MAAEAPRDGGPGELGRHQLVPPTANAAPIVPAALAALTDPTGPTDPTASSFLRAYIGSSTASTSSASSSNNETRRGATTGMEVRQEGAVEGAVLHDARVAVHEEQGEAARCFEVAQEARGIRRQHLQAQLLG